MIRERLAKGLRTVRPSGWLLVATLLAVVALWALCPQELAASDPWTYSRRAYAIASSGDFGRGDVFDLRLGVTLPLALIYKLFGVSVVTTNAWPLLAILTIVVTVWRALPDERSKIVGLLVCVTSVPLVGASLEVFPDVFAAAFMGVGVLLLSLRHRLIDETRWLRAAAVASTVALFMGALAKLSAYWVLPLWVAAGVTDLRGPRRRELLVSWYLPTAVAAVVLAGAFLWFSRTKWGDPLALFHVTEDVAGRHLWSMRDASEARYLARLTTGPWNLLTDVYGVLALGLLALGVVTLPREIRLWSAYALCGLLFFWFGPTSFREYSPMPLKERMIAPILPAALVTIAFVLSKLTGAAPLPRTSRWSVLGVFLCAQAFSMHQFWRQARGASAAEATAMTLIRQEVLAHPEQSYLLACADNRSVAFLEFYFGYRYPENLTVRFADKLSKDALRAGKHYVFVNKERSQFLERTYKKKTRTKELLGMALTTIYERNGVVLREGHLAN